MNLRWLPDAGHTSEWEPHHGYRIHDHAYAGGSVVVLGRETRNGAERSDYFVAVYTMDGERLGGSGVRTTPDIERAKELFDHWVHRRRTEAA